MAHRLFDFLHLTAAERRHRRSLPVARGGCTTGGSPLLTIASLMYNVEADKRSGDGEACGRALSNSLAARLQTSGGPPTSTTVSHMTLPTPDPIYGSGRRRTCAGRNES